MGARITASSVDATFETALKHIGYQQFRAKQTQLRRHGRYIGLGLGTFIEFGAHGTRSLATLGIPYTVGWDSATVRIEPGGAVSVSVGLAPHGQGLETTLAQVVADELGVPLESVSIQYGDTARDPYGGGLRPVEVL
jgi:carbon-monoxide dehydrogenase large subunit